MWNQSEAERAIKELDGKTLHGYQVSVQLAKTAAGPVVQPVVHEDNGNTQGFVAARMPAFVGTQMPTEADRAIEELIDSAQSVVAARTPASVGAQMPLGVERAVEELIDSAIESMVPSAVDSAADSAAKQVDDNLEPGEIVEYEPDQPPARAPSPIPTAALEGISAERLAMIAATPIEAVLPVRNIKCGPRQSGENSLPLGPRQSGENSLPLGAPRRTGPRSRDFTSDQATRGSSSRSASIDVGFREPPPDFKSGGASHPADRLMGYTSTTQPPMHGRRKGPRKPRPSKAEKASRSHLVPPGFHGQGMSDPAFPASHLHSQALTEPVYEAPTGFQNQGNVLSMTQGAVKQANKLVGKNTSEVSECGAQATGIWNDLYQHVHNIVRGAQDPTRNKNNGSDAGEVTSQVKQALKVLRPLIMRPKAQQVKKANTEFTQVKIED